MWPWVWQRFLRVHSHTILSVGKRELFPGFNCCCIVRIMFFNNWNYIWMKKCAWNFCHMRIFNRSECINWNIVDVIGQRDCWWESYWHEPFLHICVVVHSRNWVRFAFLMWGVASTLSWRLMNSLPLVSTLCLQLRYECNISHSCWRDKIYRVFLSVGREHEMKQPKRKCLLRLNIFSRKRNETHFAFCYYKSRDFHVWIEQSVPRLKRAKFCAICLYFFIFRVFTSVTSSTFSFSSLFSLQVMQ